VVILRKLIRRKSCSLKKKERKKIERKRDRCICLTIPIPGRSFTPINDVETQVPAIQVEQVEDDLAPLMAE
jgi:hypothetical protein